MLSYWPELRHLPGRLKWVAVWEAYYDHSFTGDGVTRAVTLGVLVAPERVWRRIEGLWPGAMKRGGAEGKVVHMKELVHGVGDWPGWKNADKQANLFKRLIPLIARASWGCGLSYPQTFFERVTVRNREGHTLTPLMELFGAAMSGIKAKVLATEDNPVRSYMEQDQVVENDVTRHFYYVARMRGWERIFPTIAPLPKGPAPLQAVDIIAYEGGRHAAEHELNTGRALTSDPALWLPPERPQRKLFLALKKSCPNISFSTLTLDQFIRHADASVVVGDRVRSNPDSKARMDRFFAAAAKQTQRERSALGRERKRKKGDRQK